MSKQKCTNPIYPDVYFEQLRMAEMLMAEIARGDKNVVARN